MALDILPTLHIYRRKLLKETAELLQVEDSQQEAADADEAVQNEKALHLTRALTLQILTRLAELAHDLIDIIEILDSALLATMTLPHIPLQIARRLVGFG